MRDLMMEAASHAHLHGQPLLARREPGRVGIIVLTGDRGLAGAFNGQVVRRALQVGAEHAAQGHEVVYLPAGRKGLGTLRFRGRDVLTSWTGFSDRPGYGDAEAIVDAASKAYIGRRARPRRARLQPLRLGAPAAGRGRSSCCRSPRASWPGWMRKERAQQGELLFEPEAGEMLGELLVSSLEVTVYRALLESTASEHGARMTAMRNASENAADLISAYTLAMNRARQAEITQEILEVVAGADALQ